MKVSVVIPVKNGARTLKECLEGIFSQDVAFPLEVLAIDSGSTDGSLDILRSFPVTVLSIEPGEFNHGDTRNLGAMETDGDLIVFTVQDAYPADRSWLSRLIGNLVKDPEVAGAFSRIIPRPDCGPLVENGVRGDLNFGSERIEMRYDEPRAPEGWDPHTHRLRANFNDVASALRREVWEKIPFQRTPFGEDIIWADSALRAGYKIVFDPESTVIHSHEYHPASIFPRTHIDGWFNKAYIGRYCIEKLSHVFIMTWRLFKEDRVFLKSRVPDPGRRLRESATSLAYHFMAFLGFHLGGKVPGHLPPVAPVETDPIRVLLACSSVFGSEGACTSHVLDLARRLEDQGLQVMLLFCEDGKRIAHPIRERWGGLPLFRLDAGKSGEDLEIRMPSPFLEEAFDDLLEREKPDILHCLDFRAPTADLLALGCRFGLPSLVNLSDFWFRCPRTDLVRPDGSCCINRRPPGLGCGPCLAHQHEFIFPAAWIDKGIRTLWGGRLKPKPRPYAGRKADAASSANLVGLFLRPDLMKNRLSEAETVVVPSLFGREKCIEAGIDPSKVVYIGPWASSAPPKRRNETLATDRSAGRKEPESGASTASRTVNALVVQYRQVLSRRAWRERMEAVESRV